MDTTAVSEVRMEIRESVGHLVISNVRKYNAMTQAMWLAFTSGIRTLDANPAIRVIVVRGDGNDAFMSGADISQFGSRRTAQEDQLEYDAIAEEAYTAPGLASKPVIASIRGICMGGGLGLAAACDLRICATTARLRMPAARLGLGYSVDGVMRFVGLVGPQAVLDLFMTARTFDGIEAVRVGFAAAAVDPEELDAKVASIAGAIAQNAPLTLGAVKLAVRAAHFRTPESIAAAKQAVVACAASSDYLEGQAAFREKRQPKFTGS